MLLFLDYGRTSSRRDRPPYAATAEVDREKKRENLGQVATICYGSSRKIQVCPSSCSSVNNEILKKKQLKTAQPEERREYRTRYLL